MESWGGKDKRREKRGQEKEETLPIKKKSGCFKKWLNLLTEF